MNLAQRPSVLRSGQPDTGPSAGVALALFGNSSRAAGFRPAAIGPGRGGRDRIAWTDRQLPFLTPEA